jgi:hypothetical protein
MSEKRFASIAHELQEAVTNAAWIQWQALGGQAAAPRAPGAIVDPEALVLVSLWLEDDERRLRDFLHGFAELGSRMLSVQRLKRAMGAFPPDAVGRVAGFAATVADFGKDPRWKGLARTGPILSGRSGKVGPPSTRFGEAGSLMLRLRTAFGVDVRTDTLAYLIGRRGAWAGVKEIADALFYAKYSVRGACEALADARLIKSHTDRPVKYYAEPERWTALLDLRDTAPWHPWVAIYAFVLRLLAWLRGPGAEVESSYVASSLAREFMREHGGILTQIQLDAPEGRDYLGESYLEAFEQTVFALVQRLTDVA